MRVYQFRQFRIGHELLLFHKFASLSSVFGDRIFMLLVLLFWAIDNLRKLLYLGDFKISISQTFFRPLQNFKNGGLLT
ncbi:hypothetical protein QT972_09165 [Microcoleus sp. herbarium7]|uniref:hypothetical protein n=1 Tax=Microcoleus sp. herbarium7 TaxID=3055435 RepID=UPI002FD1660D